MISDYLTDKLDVLTAKLQRRGYRLTNIQVYVLGVVFTSMVLGPWMRGSYVFMVLNGGLWGWNLWERLQWAEKHKDYPESIKQVERLNMGALYWRERFRWFTTMIIYACLFFSSLSIGLLLHEFSLGTVSMIVEWVSMTLAFVIRGCFFIGPGEFAKQKQERILQTGRRPRRLVEICSSKTI